MNFFLPIRTDSFYNQFQRFSHRHFLMFSLIEVTIDRIKPRVTRVIIVYKRRRVIEGLPPKLDLLRSINFSSFFFGVTLQSSIMPFINPPRFFDMNGVFKTHFLYNQTVCFMGSLQQRGVCDIEVVPGFLEVLTSLDSFVLSCFVEWYVNPPAKFSLLVPQRLTMSHENNLEFCFRFDRIFD